MFSVCSANSYDRIVLMGDIKNENPVSIQAYSYIVESISDVK
jgi:hypothetical protein